MVSFTTILISILLFLIAFSISLLNAKLDTKEYMYLFSYPLLSIARIFYNFPPFRGVRSLIKNTTRKHVIEAMTTQAIVSDGANDYQCKLELISDDGLARVTFINANGLIISNVDYERLSNLGFTANEINQMDVNINGTEINESME